MTMFENKKKILLKILIVLIFSSIFVHQHFNVPPKAKNCPELISPSLKNHNHTWKPTGCSLIHYDMRMTIDCISKTVSKSSENKNLSFVLMGDSHQREITHRFIERIFGERYTNFFKLDQTFYLSSNETDFKLHYMYRPFFTDSARETFIKWEKQRFSPDLLVLHSNLHAINEFKEFNVIHEFRKNLTSYLVILNKLALKVPVLWYIQPPVVEEKLKKHRRGLTNEKVNLFTSVAMEVLKESRVALWTSARIIAEERLINYKDDVHVGCDSLEMDVQILLNFFCNSRIPVPKRACCQEQRYEKLFKFEAAACVCLAVLLLFSAIQMSRFSMQHNGSSFQLQIHGFHALGNKISAWSTIYSLVVALGKGSIYLGVLFLIDRRVFFNKEERHSTTMMSTAFFFIIIAVIFCFKREKISEQEIVKILLQETRGVIVVLLLIFSLNDTFGFSPFRGVIHVLESSLIFMAGLDYFLDFWSSKATGFYFYLQNVFFQNLLALLMCAVMMENYQFYQIMPLIFLFYHINFLVSKCPLSEEEEMKSEKGLLCFAIKSLFIIVIISSISSYQNKAQWIFSLPFWNMFFLTKDGVMEPWLQRWEMDKYNYVFGVLFGVLLKSCSAISSRIKFFTNIKKFPFNLIVFFIGGSFIVLSHNFLHPYLSTPGSLRGSYPLIILLLIFGYALLRYSVLMKINTYSPYWSWLGSLWLELFLLHYHVWTSNDGTAVLQLLPNPLINLIFNFVFIVFLAYEFHLIIKLLVHLLI